MSYGSEQGTRSSFGGHGTLRGAMDGTVQSDSAKRELLPETEAWLRQAIQYGGKPSWYYIKAIDNFIRQLIFDGNWNLFDRLWLFATEQRQHATISLVNPKGITTAWPTNAIETPSTGVINWSALSGYKSNGSAFNLNTQYNPSTNGVNFKLNNNSWGFDSPTSLAFNTITPFVIVSNDGTNINTFQINTTYTTGGATGGISVNNGGSVSSPTSLIYPYITSSGLWASRRTASASQDLWQNGINVGTDTVQTTTAICSSNFKFQPATTPLYVTSFGFMGSGSINQLKLYNSLKTLSQVLGFAI